jgi:hypothetical protein
MIALTRYSEPYNATGGLAAEGVLNQLGRPDVEPLEVLVREAVQNCWDARRDSERGITVDIGRVTLHTAQVDAVREQMLVDPPPGLPLGRELTPGMEVLYFADYGTAGLGGPTRADHAAPGEVRDFVDFVRNIGQPPDKELGGGSFGYGKAAFYIASRARTIVVDTLCDTPEGPERRLIGCGLGENFIRDGRPFTGRHWWGRMVDEVPEPLIGEAATAAAQLLDLPDRSGTSGLGTTVAIVAPGVRPDSPDGSDPMMDFVADALAWNFWPRMTSTPGGVGATMTFRLTDQGRRIRLPDPRIHPRLRGFVEAMDRLRVEPEDDDLVIDRPIDCLRPMQRLGRLVVQRGPVAPTTPPDRAVPQGARQTAHSVHHVALMRNAELVVKYLRGPEPVTGRIGYSGVFRCAIDVDEAFRRAEPPTHDDWVYRFVPGGHDRTFVKVALERIAGVCREAAGHEGAVQPGATGADVPLGEFADALATLMPGLDGPGARKPGAARATGRGRRRHAPGRTSVAGVASSDVWVEGGAAREGAAEGNGGTTASDGQGPPGSASTGPARSGSVRPPQVRAAGDPRPDIAGDGAAVLRFPFELRGHGSRVRLAAFVEVMTNDGAQVEAEPPRGWEPPAVRAWVDPTGALHASPELVVDSERTDGLWIVEVPIRDEAMIRVNVRPEIA